VKKVVFCFKQISFINFLNFKSVFWHKSFTLSFATCAGRLISHHNFACSTAIISGVIFAFFSNAFNTFNFIVHLYHSFSLNIISKSDSEYTINYAGNSLDFCSRFFKSFFVYNAGAEPSTTHFLPITHFTTSSCDGTVNIISPITSSIIERSPLAPV